jgi:hypothetical protein
MSLPYETTAASWADGKPKWLRSGAAVTMRFVICSSGRETIKFEPGVVHEVDYDRQVVTAAFTSDKSTLYSMTFAKVREGWVQPSLELLSVEKASSDPCFHDEEGRFSLGEIWATSEEGVAFPVRLRNGEKLCHKASDQKMRVRSKSSRVNSGI